ncbi:hypothetical protein K3495_g11346 [Podosphaera aphanis]|nr:hypothetical protein K3495_g11346 [Podosphaera aphanis]
MHRSTGPSRRRTRNLFPVDASGNPYTPEYATIERAEQAGRLPQICCRALELANLKGQQEEACNCRHAEMKETADVETADAPVSTVALIFRVETRKAIKKLALTKKQVRPGTFRKGFTASPGSKPQKPLARGKGKGSGNTRKN